VAAAAKPGDLIRFKGIHHCGMYGVVLETSGAGVAMQALSVLEFLESALYANDCRIEWRAHILHLNAVQTLHLVI